MGGNSLLTLLFGTDENEKNPMVHKLEINSGPLILGQVLYALSHRFTVNLKDNKLHSRICFL